jgi:hypothetical protein
MTEIIHTITGADEVIRAMEEAGDLNPVKRIIQMAGFHLKSIIAEYPPIRRLTRKEVYGSSFKTIKQRKFFFWALRNGRIEVPYVRGSSPGSESLKHRWTVASILDGLGVSIGNNASYVKWVQDKEFQSKYHAAGGWIPAQTTLEKERTNIVQEITTEIVMFVKRKFGKA